MFRGLSRPLAVVLLAVLAATPVVRALCALECRAERTAYASAPAEHCARPTVDSDLLTFELRGSADCPGCDASARAVQASLRAEAKAPVAALAHTMPAATPDELAATAGAAAVPLPGSPPLRAPYPLRI